MNSRGLAGVATARLRSVLGEPGSGLARSLLADDVAGPSGDRMRADGGAAGPDRALTQSFGKRNFDPQRHGALALAALAFVAAIAAGAVALRARPQLTRVPTPVQRVAAVPSSSSSQSAAAVLVVDISGGVRRPGLLRLPAGSRVADAVTAAGGPLPGTPTADLNLARKLTDGEQVVVGRKPVAGVPQAATASAAAAAVGAEAAPIDINTATATDLERLPGVGPVLAQRIFQWRSEHGAFASVDQLREIDGIGERTFASLRSHVTV